MRFGSHGSNGYCGASTRPALTRVLALALLAGCHASSGSSRALITARNAPAPASLVVSVLQGDAETDETFYARSDARPASWASAAVLRIPPASNSGLTVLADFGAAPVAAGGERPLLFVLRGRSLGGPPVQATLSEVGRARVAVAPLPSDGHRPCLGSDWLAAFFVEGFGPRPTGPAVVVFSANGPDGQPQTVHRLRVDPRRHTLRTAPALVLRTGDAGIDSTIRERLVVSASVSASVAAMPLVLSRFAIGGRYRWDAAMGDPRRKEVSFLQMAETPRPVPDRWVVFVLDEVPRC
jgi:hypothetical protein